MEKRSPERNASAGIVDTEINVAQLLKQPVGATRRYQLSVGELPLGEERTARQIEGPIKLTRIGQGLLVTGEPSATVELTCVRCLEDYTENLTLHLEEEFRPSIDVNSGLGVTYTGQGGESEDDFFLIDEDHVLDLAEALRQAVWLAAPMMPRCREDCPGIPLPETDAGEAEPAATDQHGEASPFAVLERLLDDGPAGEAAPNGTHPGRQRGRQSAD